MLSQTEASMAGNACACTQDHEHVMKIFTATAHYICLSCNYGGEVVVYKVFAGRNGEKHCSFIQCW